MLNRNLLQLKIPSKTHTKSKELRDGDPLASAYCGSENIVIEAVVISELKFSDVERQVLFADFVEAAHDAAFDDRPETLDCIGVNRANYIMLSVLAFSVITMPIA